jgi:hypothetical protein
VEEFKILVKMKNEQAPKMDVFILAAGTIKHKISYLKYTFNSPALIPINTEPLAGIVIKYYRNILPKATIHLAINEEILSTVKKYLSMYDGIINYVPIKESTNGVVGTLKTIIKKVNPLGNVIVNLVTTIPTIIPAINEVLISNNKRIVNEWASINILNSKVNFIYKNDKNVIEGYGFTGTFCTNQKLLGNALSQLNINKYNDLLYVVEEIHKSQKLTYIKIDWVDCGHESNYHQAKTKYISSRSFNKIKVDPIKGVLTKFSEHVDKLSNEAEFVKKLPSNLSVLFPRILDVKNKNRKAHIKMEYYGYPSLSEYMLFWDLNNGFWLNIFDALKVVCSSFKDHKVRNITLSNYLEFYLGKTLNRLIEYKQQLGEKNWIFSDELIINNYKYKNINLLKNKIEEKLKKLYNGSEFCVMHGDLCFNNILYDLYSGTIRLIDARGSFGPSIKSIYGDQLYDIAKISHSVIGAYDYIVNGFYSYTEEKNNFYYKIHERKDHNIITKLNNEFILKLDYKLSDISLIMGLLFIAMTPLHNDDVTRQKVFYLHGIKFLNEATEVAQQ